MSELKLSSRFAQRKYTALKSDSKPSKRTKIDLFSSPEFDLAQSPSKRSQTKSDLTVKTEPTDLNCFDYHPNSDDLHFPTQNHSINRTAKTEIRENTENFAYNPNEILEGSWSTVGSHEKILRKFDLDLRYGPSAGLTRYERVQRAEKLGLKPPQQIKDILEKYELTKIEQQRLIPFAKNGRIVPLDAGVSSHSIFENLVQRTIVADENVTTRKF